MTEVDKILPQISKRARELGYNIQHLKHESQNIGNPLAH